MSTNEDEDIINVDNITFESFDELNEQTEEKDYEDDCFPC